jgi:hypothetical protein
MTPEELRRSIQFIARYEGSDAGNSALDELCKALTSPKVDLESTKLVTELLESGKNLGLSSGLLEAAKEAFTRFDKADDLTTKRALHSLGTHLFARAKEVSPP